MKSEFHGNIIKNKLSEVIMGHTQLKDEELLEKYAALYGYLKFTPDDTINENILKEYKAEILKRIVKNDLFLLSLSMEEALTNESVVNDGICVKEISTRLISDLNISSNKSTNEARMIFCMDISGSMGEFERYMAKSFLLWNEVILKSIYKKVSKEFVIHNTEAWQADESDFYARREAGGTIISSGWNKVNDIVNSYDYKKQNTFIFIISDGDNLTSDNERAIRILEDLQRKACHITYFEINQFNRSSTLSHALKNVNYDSFEKVVVRDKDDIYKAIKTLWNHEEKLKD
jgi:hypothetical protein